jgi:hypothetical protein
VTVPGAFAIELRGTRASALYGFGGERLLVKGEDFDPDAWTEQALDPAEAAPFERFVTRLRGEDVADPTAAAAIDLTRLVLAAEAAGAQA